MKNLFKGIMPQLITGLITGVIMLLIGAGIKTRTDKDAQKPRSLDSLITINYQNADKTEMQEKKIQILYDRKPINSFSQISVQLYNFSDEAFKDIPVFIEIIPAEGDTLKVIDSTITGTNNLPEKIIHSNDPLTHTVKGSLKYKYVIRNANIDDGSFQPILTAKYFILGNKKPNIKLDIDLLDVSLEGYDRSHYNKIPWYKSDWFIIFYVLIIYVLIIFIVVKIANYSQKKRNERFGIYIRNNLTDKINSGLKFIDAETIVTEYRKTSDKFDYVDASPFKRWIKQMKKPE